jgi:hypothetical protein
MGAKVAQLLHGHFLFDVEDVRLRHMAWVNRSSVAYTSKLIFPHK